MAQTLEGKLLVGQPMGEAAARSRSRSRGSEGAPAQEDAVQGRQRQQLWEAEVFLRMRTAGLTSQEKVEIRAANRRDMDIINLFGTRPAIMATQMKLAELVYQDPYAPEPRGGDLAEPTTPVWTLMKGNLLSTRSSQRLQTGYRARGCRCLDSSYFMPKGCPHELDNSDGEVPSGRCRDLLCSTCSRCLRCDGFCWHLDQLPKCSCTSAGLFGSGFVH